MKKCPKCQNVFDDDLNFCLEDGAILQLISVNDSAPTQIIPAGLVTAQTKKPFNPGIYLIIGAMTALIVGLAVFVIYLISDDATVSTENKHSQKVKAGNTAAGENTGESAEKISETEVRNLLNKWKQAQETKNIADYQSCYGKTFTGIKRTTESSSTYDYDSWMKDRRLMIANASGLSLEISDLLISIDEDIATVNFEQIYRSSSYSDRGQKVLKIKKFNDGEKIIYEELKYAIPLR